MKSRHSFALAAAAFALAATMASPVLARRGSDDPPGDDRRESRQEDRRDDSRSSSSTSSSSSNSSSTSSSSSAASQKVKTSEFEGRARDNDSPVVAKAKYREKVRGSSLREQKFDVEIKFAQPGQRFDITVGGKKVGTATANALGIAKLELRRSPSGPNEQLIPAGFPRLKAGSKVQVSDISVTLRRKK